MLLLVTAVLEGGLGEELDVVVGVGGEEVAAREAVCGKRGRKGR